MAQISLMLLLLFWNRKTNTFLFFLLFFR